MPLTVCSLPSGERMVVRQRPPGRTSIACLRRGEAFRPPPFHQLFRLGPQREQPLGRGRDDALHAQRDVVLGLGRCTHDFLRFGVSAAMTASSRSKASDQWRCWRSNHEPSGRSASGRARTTRNWRSTRFSIRPAVSSTCRWRVIAGAEMRNGLAISPTVLSPSASRRSTMARRVGSASAAKTDRGRRRGSLRGSLINQYVN